MGCGIEIFTVTEAPTGSVTCEKCGMLMHSRTNRTFFAYAHIPEAVDNIAHRCNLGRNLAFAIAPSSSRQSIPNETACLRPFLTSK
jgi:hypothetical protein